MAADWSNLTEDLLISVAKLLVSFEDVLAFGGVCTTWRAASWAAKTDSCSLSSGPHQAPWLVSFRGNKKVSGRWLRVEIDSLSPQRPRRSRLLRPSSRFRKAEVVLSSLGWLLTKGCISNEVSLFNPSSRAQIRLPTLLDFIRKFVLSANPSSSKDYKVIVLTQSHVRRGMAVWKPGKVAWNELTNLEGFFSDVVCHNGLVWAVDFYSSSVVALNIEELDESPVTVVRMLFMTPEMDIQSLKAIIGFYVVESEGEILVVRVEQAVSEPSEELEPVSFRVYKVRDGRDEFERVFDLGDKALFLGNGTSSFAVKASDFAGCQANCIYLAENYKSRTSECAVVGIFSLGDVTFKSYLFRYDNDRDYFLPPLWVQPTF